MDLYRVASEEEIYFLNLKDYFCSDGITLVEWAERAYSFLPAERLEVYFETLGQKERKIRFKGVLPDFRKILKDAESVLFGKAT